MPSKPIVWLIDTSIFLNVLDIPGFNQKRSAVFEAFEFRIEQGDSFLLPFTSILETGNHIAQLPRSNQRLAFAKKFTEIVSQSIDGKAPWKPLAFPSQTDLVKWLVDFHYKAEQGIGLGDHLIIKHWEEECKKLLHTKNYIVKIWSNDGHLLGYECNF